MYPHFMTRKKGALPVKDNAQLHGSSLPVRHATVLGTFRSIPFMGRVKNNEANLLQNGPNDHRVSNTFQHNFF